MFNSFKRNVDWSKNSKRPRIENPNHKANYKLVYSTRKERIFVHSVHGGIQVHYRPMVRVS